MRYRNENTMLPEPMVDYSKLPLGIHAYDGDILVALLCSATETMPSVTLYKSYDAVNWTLMDDIYETNTVLNGLTLYFYGPSTNIISKSEFNNCYRHFVFSGTGKVELVGQMLSICNPNWATEPFIRTGATILYLFTMLFRELPHIYTAENLHINVETMNLQSYSAWNCAFAYVLANCTNLIHGAVFDYPSTIVNGNAGFYGFYKGCTSLLNAEVPSLRVGYTKCLDVFFDGCSSLTEITYKGSASLSYDKFSNGVPSTGTFYNLGGATYSTGTSGIPSGWTVLTTK